MKLISGRLFTLAKALVAIATASAAPSDRRAFMPVIDELAGQTLFAFDNVSIPFTRSLALEMRKPEKHPGNPVVKRGPRSEPDHWGVQFYGSIIRVGDKFRLWYAALDGARGEQAEQDPSFWRVAYAESTDGVNWIQMGSTTLAMPQTVYFGMAVSSKSDVQTATAEFRNLGDVLA